MCGRVWGPTPGRVWNIYMERGGDGWDRDDGRGGSMLRWFQLSGRGRQADSATERKISICSTPSPVAATAMLTAAVAQGNIVGFGSLQMHNFLHSGFLKYEQEFP